MVVMANFLWFQSYGQYKSPIKLEVYAWVHCIYPNRSLTQNALYGAYSGMDHSVCH